MAARRQLLDGIDPLQAKAAARAERVKAEAATVTFEAAAQGYFDAQSIKWRNPKHRAQFLSTMKTFAYPILGKLPVADIDTPLVLKVMEQPVKAERGYAHASGRVFPRPGRWFCRGLEFKGL